MYRHYGMRPQTAALLQGISGPHFPNNCICGPSVIELTCAPPKGAPHAQTPVGAFVAQYRDNASHYGPLGCCRFKGSHMNPTTRRYYFKYPRTCLDVDMTPALVHQHLLCLAAKQHVSITPLQVATGV